MYPQPSPLESLAANAVAFTAGAVTALCLSAFIRSVKEEARTAARPSSCPDACPHTH